MKRVYLIRNGVSLDEIRDFADFIDGYPGRRFKVVYFEDSHDPETDLIQVETLVRSCTRALLFLGSDITSRSPYLDHEIRCAFVFGLKKFVLTLDEENYPAGLAKGVPITWRLDANTVFKASEQNIVLGILGIGQLKYINWP
ncbi:MAG: hypothetical protein ACFFE8_07515 [Candidatus Heimdallarchaeota archaeon]